MISLALIGNGKWGSNYLNEIKNIPDAEIKYIRNEDYADLIGKKDIDGIIIASPDATHASIIKDFPDSFLLVEKPVVMSLDESLLLKNEKIMAGHIYLYNLALLEMLKGIKKIQRIDFSIKNTEAVKNTSPLWYLAPHGIALAVHLLGLPKDVSAWEDAGNLFIELGYPSVIVNIEVGWNYSEKSRSVKINNTQDLEFTEANNQKISPLENQLRAFINFIKGEKIPSNLEHIKEVTYVLSQIEELIA